MVILLGLRFGGHRCRAGSGSLTATAFKLCIHSPYWALVS